MYHLSLQNGLIEGSWVPDVPFQLCHGSCNSATDSPTYSSSSPASCWVGRFCSGRGDSRRGHRRCAPSGHNGKVWMRRTVNVAGFCAGSTNMVVGCSGLRVGMSRYPPPLRPHSLYCRVSYCTSLTQNHHAEQNNYRKLRSRLMIQEIRRTDL